MAFLLGSFSIWMILTTLPASASISSATLSLSSSWKFATDPNNIGQTQQWYTEAFNDSSWQTLLSGKSWESQGINYAGYAWYRQNVTIPVTSAGVPLKITLASIYSDDDFYFNGVRMGGIKGEYKYNNLKVRTYSVPASLVRYGAPNTIAMRIWGGKIGGRANSGLVSGTYTITLDPFQLSARDVGASITSEQPIELYDLSAAQQGKPFELVVRINPVDVTQPSPSMIYALTDFYGSTIKTGTTPVTPSADGLYRGVITIDTATAQRIYVAGRFNVQYQIVQTGQGFDWTDTGLTLASTQGGFMSEIFSKNFLAGQISLPPLNSGSIVAVNTPIIPDNTVVISGLHVNDTAHASGWSVQQNLQAGNILFGDRTYTISSLASAYAGAQWIRTAEDSKFYTGNPMATFTISKPTTMYLAVDKRAVLPWIHSISADHLSFASRENVALPALASTYENTPYGSLKLVDKINASTDLSTEVHPYLQGTFSVHPQDYMTPGALVSVSVDTILGKQAREFDYGWFAYRIGRGTLTPGKTYLLRIEYPEDKPRYSPIEIQVGQNYLDVGWKNGVSPTDVYENWPLSNTWQYYDVVVPLGKETTGTGGTDDGDAQKGFWVYFMNKVKPGSYFYPFSGGPAVATIKLYEIDPVANAPQITLPPAGLPQRVMTVDWERQVTQLPADIVSYAKLMGYSAVSPIAGIKWNFQNWADPVAGYNSANVDSAGYWVTRNYTIGSGTPPPPAVPGVQPVHSQYLAATKSLGLDYIPRFEYGGSYDLPVTAQSIGADGTTAKPNRYATWSANLLDPATFADLKAYLDSFIKPYAASNPQLKGALWRIRSDRMQISYGQNDVTMFSTETSTPLPSGFASYTPAQVSAWASTGTIGAAYSTWWQGKRRDFDQQVVNLLKSYRSDLTLYYYNWDSDKFSLMEPDINSAAFYGKVASLGGPTAYAIDRAARAAYTVNDYINVFNTGHFIGTYPSLVRPDINWADYALRPSLYANVSGIELLAPVNALPYATVGYLNYFQTKDGLAVSNAVSYDELGAREVNPKYEGNMVLPGGGPFSMAMELLSYYNGDARTLTYTVYTYGRGFADAHRRFAEAFRAIPAIPGTLVGGTPADVAARVYPTASNGTYIGIAYKGYMSQSLTIDLPGTWTSSMVVTNLVTNQTIPTVIVGGKLRISLNAGPIELDAFRVTGGEVVLSHRHAHRVSGRSKTVPGPVHILPESG